MKFFIEQKGQHFLVVGDSNKSVYGNHAKRAEANYQCQQLQARYDNERRHINNSADALSDDSEA